MSRALRALGEGVWTVLRAPLLIAGLALLTMATAAPFGVLLGSRLQASLDRQPPVSRDAGEIDAEWWMEFRHHARGLDSTFTPTVLGFAAPLDNLSALLDGSPRPLVLVAPVAAYGLLWAFLWGGLLARFDRGRALPLRELWRYGRQHVGPFVVIGLAASVVSLILFLSVHAWLFGPVFEWLAGRASGERNAFLWRLVLYGAFGSVLATIGLVADYARISRVSAGARTVGEAIASGAAFVRTHALAVALLYVLTGTLFVALLAVYGLTEIYGGTRVGGWRAVLIGQAYIVARLGIRLTLAASEVRLFRYLQGTAGIERDG